MKKETTFKIKVLNDLEEFKRLGTAWFYKTQEVSRRGVPDIVGCFGGTFVSMELKVDSPIDPLQQYTLDRIEKAGGKAWIVTPTTWSAYLKKLKNLVHTQEELKCR